MKIGILSDSHDHVHHTLQAMAVFKENAVDQVIHAGDHASPAVVKAMKGLPVSGVFGNNDGEKMGLLKAYQRIDGRLGGDFLSLTIDKRKIAVYHGTVTQITESLILGGLFDVVITGHTHKVVDTMEKKVRALNPGSIHGFDETATFMIYDTETDHAEVLTL
ncbi:metallophosphoesterase [Magnetococcales bacterium HHB-1]